MKNTVLFLLAAILITSCGQRQNGKIFKTNCIEVEYEHNNIKKTGYLYEHFVKTSVNDTVSFTETTGFYCHYDTISFNRSKSGDIYLIESCK